MLTGAPPRGLGIDKPNVSWGAALLRLGALLGADRADRSGLRGLRQKFVRAAAFACRAEKGGSGLCGTERETWKGP